MRIHMSFIHKNSQTRYIADEEHFAFTMFNSMPCAYTYACIQARHNTQESYYYAPRWAHNTVFLLNFHIHTRNHIMILISVFTIFRISVWVFIRNLGIVVFKRSTIQIERLVLAILKDKIDWNTEFSRTWNTSSLLIIGKAEIKMFDFQLSITPTKS